MMRFIAIALLLAAVPLFGQTAQWRGPDRTGIYPDTSLLKEWPEEGPELLLKVEGIGDGLSSAVLEGERIYITGKKDSTDYLSALDLQGQILWQVPYGKSWGRTYSGSRCTPTVFEGRVYVESGTGQLACLDAGSGEILWAVDADREYEAVYHFFGVAESPLIVDDKVICMPSGERTTAVAFNRVTGEEIWVSPPVEGRKAYASPILYEHGDIRLILGFTSKNLVAIDPETGLIPWTYYYFQHSFSKGQHKSNRRALQTSLKRKYHRHGKNQHHYCQVLQNYVVLA